MTSSFDGPAVAAAHRIQSLARIAQTVAGVLAAASLAGAIFLATRRPADCYHVLIIGGGNACAGQLRSYIPIAVVGELAVLFGLFLVYFAAQYASFRAEVYLAQAERGARPDGR